MGSITYFEIIIKNLWANNTGKNGKIIIRNVGQQNPRTYELPRSRAKLLNYTVWPKHAS